MNTNCIFRSFILAAMALAAISCTKEGRLAEWRKDVTRPNFRLLDSLETAVYLIAAFDTGKNEVAFCYRWIGSASKPAAHALSIRDERGKDLSDPERKERTDLSRRRAYGVPSVLEFRNDTVDGISYSVRPGYRGPISIRFSDGTGKDSNYRVVYEKAIRLTAE